LAAAKPANATMKSDKYILNRARNDSWREKAILQIFGDDGELKLKEIPKRKWMKLVS